MRRPNAFLAHKDFPGDIESPSRMNRYFIPAETWKDEDLLLTGEEARHCSRVMRANEGDVIEVFDGRGVSATCKIGAIHRDSVSCHILEQQSSPPVAHPVTLCQAIPKGGNMELIVQKAVELGTSKIQPLITEHTVARPQALEKKSAKWQRIALEACKQCGQNHLPEILTPKPFESWLRDLDFGGTRLIAALSEGARHLHQHFQAHAPQGGIMLLVGPEGDFSTEEYDAAFQSGFQPISFGDIVMRVETASLYGLSIIQHELSA